MIVARKPGGVHSQPTLFPCRRERSVTSPELQRRECQGPGQNLLPCLPGHCSSACILLFPLASLTATSCPGGTLSGMHWATTELLCPLTRGVAKEMNHLVRRTNHLVSGLADTATSTSQIAIQGSWEDCRHSPGPGCWV